jgi:arginyl-tRNA synthetase
VVSRNAELPPGEITRIAESIGMAALKYADLSQDRVKDYVFSFDRMLAFEGNTGPYLLYAIVRIKSIFRKAIEKGVSTAGHESAPLLLKEPAEKALALSLLRYPSAVRAVGESLEPHRLCTYAYELAGAFSAFFENCPVLLAEDPAVRLSRLRLASLTARVLEDALHTLGIPTIDRM